MRLKSTWYKKEKQHSPEETAGALGFIAWQIAVTRVKHMEGQGFRIDLPDRTLDVIAEFLIYIIQLTDRWAYEKYSDEDRGRLVVALAKKLALTMHDNRLDIHKQGEFAGPFIDLVNQRMSDYAEFQYEPKEPAFPVYRYLAMNIQNAVEGKDGRWILEQVAELEGPEATDTLLRALNNLV